jgi:hypothetical protein
MGEIIGCLQREISDRGKIIVRADPIIELHVAYLDEIGRGEVEGMRLEGDMLTVEADNRTVTYRLGEPVDGRPNRYARLEP